MEEKVFEYETNKYSITNCNKCYKGKVWGARKEDMEGEGEISFSSGGLGRSPRRMRPMTGDGARQANIQKPFPVEKHHVS